MEMEIASPETISDEETETPNHDNKNGKVKVPSCHLRDTDDDAY